MDVSLWVCVCVFLCACFVVYRYIICSMLWVQRCVQRESEAHQSFWPLVSLWSNVWMNWSASHLHLLRLKHIYVIFFFLQDSQCISLRNHDRTISVLYFNSNSHEYRSVLIQYWILLHFKNTYLSCCWRSPKQIRIVELFCLSAWVLSSP